MNTNPIIYPKELNIMESIHDFQCFSFDHIQHKIIDPDQFLYVDIAINIRICSYLPLTERSDDSDSLQNSDQHSTTCPDYYEQHLHNKQHLKSMNTFESKDLNYIDSIPNPPETSDSEVDPFEHFKMLKLIFEDPTLAESRTSFVPMITNKPNPQHNSGFPLPSKGIHYIPNYHNSPP